MEHTSSDPDKITCTIWKTENCKRHSDDSNLVTSISGGVGIATCCSIAWIYKDSSAWKYGMGKCRRIDHTSDKYCPRQTELI